MAGKFLLRKAARTDVKIKVALQGPAGSGKTFSALKMAYGLVGSADKILLIDTENGSGDLYCDMFDEPYNVITLNEFSPDNYIGAINAGIEAGMEVIILDSISHEWDWLLDYVDKVPGKSKFSSGWKKASPLHENFIQHILQCNAHIIATMRSKTEYVIEKNEKGLNVPIKLGLKSKQRDGVDYEFTTIFELDTNNNATASKDRTSLFPNTRIIKIDESVGEELKGWMQASGEMREKVLSQFKDELTKLDSSIARRNTYESYKIAYPHLQKKFLEFSKTLPKLEDKAAETIPEGEQAELIKP